MGRDEQCHFNPISARFKQVAHSLFEFGKKPKVATLVKKLGSGIPVDLYTIGGSVSLIHTNYMVNHNSQQCREHKKIHIPLHLAEDVGFGDDNNKPEC